MKNWTDSDKRAYQKSLKIRDESHKQGVIQCIERNENSLEWNHKDLTFVFFIYNNYLAYNKGDEMDISCWNCRAYVVSVMKRFVRLWKEKDSVTENGNDRQKRSTSKGE